MSDAAGVGTTIVLSILVVVGIVGNTLVCVVMMKNRDMRYANNETTFNLVLLAEVSVQLYIVQLS